MDTPTLAPPHASAATAPIPAAPFAGRRDLYAPIHKALRLFMTRTLTRLGAADPGRTDEVGGALAQLERLLALCEVHLKDENAFVHPALERARPGSAARVAAEHVHHAQSIADLRALADGVAGGGAALARLYRALALFVAENFQHMHEEETQHNAVLWAAYTDAQLLAIEQALVASIPPEAVTEAMHWFMPALNASERALMLSEMRQGMPPEPFRAMLGIAERTLDAPAYARLRRDLGLPAAA